MSKTLYVSFFTDDYAVPAGKLVRSLIEHHLDHEVTRREDMGAWSDNCGSKPLFIKEMMERHADRPVSWTDADSVVRRFPSLLEEHNLNADVAVCEYTWPQSTKREVFSGTVWFSNTEAAGRFVDTWVALQGARPELWDQVNLLRTLDLARELGVRTYRLPVEYCFIFDLHRRAHPKAAPVIEHFQHSRVTKKKGRA